MKSFWKGQFLTFVLVLVDVLAFAAIWRLAWEFRQNLNARFPVPINEWVNYYAALPVLLPVWIAIMAVFEHYSHRSRTSSLNQIGNVIRAGLGILIATLAMATLLKGYSLGRSVILLNAAGATLYIYASRTLLRRLKQHYVAQGHGLTRVVIIGAGETGRAVAARIRNHPEIGYRLIGFIDRDPAKVQTLIDGVPVLATDEDLIPTLLRHRVEEVFLAVPRMPPGETFTLVHLCEQARVQFKVVSSNLLRVITESIKLEEIGDHSVILLKDGHLSPVNAFLKRSLDLAIAIPVSLLVLPFMAIITLIIRLDSDGAAIFSQERIGKDGRRFRLYKFRTMYDTVEPYAPAPNTPEDPRITRIGKFLRRTSLDELPQLWNVIKGDMSVVGPRPEMPFVVAQYEPWQKRRLDVPQGITGLWQVAGRKKLPLHLNLEYDFYYIRNWSLILDVVILIKTVRVVLTGAGAF